MILVTINPAHNHLQSVSDSFIMRKQSTISLDVSSDTNSTSSENTFTQSRYREKQFKGKGTKVRVGELEAMVDMLKRAVEQRMEMMKTL